MSEDLRMQIARVLEPQAWAALVTGDTLAYRSRRTSSERKADAILSLLGGTECVTCGKPKSAHYGGIHCPLYATYRSRNSLLGIPDEPSKPPMNLGAAVSTNKRTPV